VRQFFRDALSSLAIIALFVGAASVAWWLGTIIR
jgi:hypothetical protein